ncbi:MAG: hypothetical protein D6689_08970 [Deltaproteobacteria bacterium]|nr:MAG: hypothetical protein D6689_08970 [Deltaproteobacteria bacterium]
MPTSPSPLARRASVAGGTAAATGPGPALWIGVAAVAIAAAVAVYVVASGGGGDAPDTAPAAEPAPVPAAAAPRPEDLAAVPDEPAFADAAAGVDDRAALDALSAELAAARVWSEVDSAGEDSHTVRIESAHCDEPALRAAIAARAADLRAAGFALVTCVSQHGVEIFSEALR